MFLTDFFSHDICSKRQIKHITKKRRQVSLLWGKKNGSIFYLTYIYISSLLILKTNFLMPKEHGVSLHTSQMIHQAGSDPCFSKQKVIDADWPTTNFLGMYYYFPVIWLVNCLSGPRYSSRPVIRNERVDRLPISAGSGGGTCNKKWNWVDQIHLTVTESHLAFICSLNMS